MCIEEIIKKIELHPWAMGTGTPKLAKRWHCSADDIYTAKEILRHKTHTGKAKILIFDIETSPIKAWVWNRWKQNVYLEQTISEWFMICWSAKWLGSEYTMYDCLRPNEVIKEDDSRITKTLWNLFNEADIIVAHNGDNFDIPKMNSRFIVHGLVPPTTYSSIDTKKVAKTVFGFSSNKLDALATYFKIENKAETDFELWKRCLEGEQEALDYMAYYNRKDVEILEQVYLKLRPYIKNHPNLANINSSIGCAACGSENLELLEGQYYYTGVSKFQLYRCRDCGALVRGRKNLAGKVKTISVQR